MGGNEKPDGEYNKRHHPSGDNSPLEDSPCQDERFCMQNRVIRRAALGFQTNEKDDVSCPDGLLESSFSVHVSELLQIVRTILHRDRAFSLNHFADTLDDIWI